MKRYLTYLMLLMAVLACQKNEDVYTPVLTTVQIELGTAEAVSKSNSPLEPDVENLIHDVWVIQFSERGVLYTGIDKFYRTEGQDGARLVTLEAQVMSGKSTICLLANLNKANSPEKFFDTAALKANLPDNLPQFKNTLLDMTEFLHFVNCNTVPGAIPMFGYWEGTIETGSLNMESECLNVTMGRMLSRINLTLVNKSGSQMTNLRFKNAASKTYYFPQITDVVLPDEAYCSKDMALDYTLKLPNGHSGSIYFYWAPNLCSSVDKATEITITAEDGSTYSCLLTNGHVSEENTDYNLYHNCNYTVTVTLE